MNESELRQEICRVGRSLFERGYIHSTAGNISVRLADGFLITPTEACLGFLKPEALSKVGADGVQVSGDRASKTLTLHRRIYAADSDAGCVIHTHSTHLVALTLAGVWKQEDILPPLTPYYVMKVGHVPLIEYYRPGDATVGDLVAQTIERMRAHEAKFNEGHPRRRDTEFVRKGDIKGPRQPVPEPVLRRIEAEAGPLMRRLGYLGD